MGSPFSICLKEHPKWFQLRWRLSNAVLAIAKWIYPSSPDVWAWKVQHEMMKAMAAEMDAKIIAGGEIYGRSPFIDALPYIQALNPLKKSDEVEKPPGA